MPSKSDLLRAGVAKGIYPDRVYKYRDLGDRTHEIIQNASMWFATAESFNDPFDCNLSETLHHTLSDLEGYLTHLKATPIEHASIVKIHHTAPEKIRDICIQAKNKAVNERGILSLSKTASNILMWSHYAREHTGVALGFDMREDPEFFLDLFAVKYHDTYEELNYFRNREETITKNLSTKAELWNYEQELRVIKPLSKAWSFQRECLREVVFGCRVSDDRAEAFIKHCRDNGFGHAVFLKAQMKHGEFALSMISADGRVL